MNLSPRTTPLQLILLTQWLLRAVVKKKAGGGGGGEDSTIIPLFWYSILQTTEIQVHQPLFQKNTQKWGWRCSSLYLGHQSAQYMKISFYGDINLHGIIWRLFLFVCLFVFPVGRYFAWYCIMLVFLCDLYVHIIHEREMCFWIWSECRTHVHITKTQATFKDVSLVCV